MLVSLTVGKVDAGVAVLLTEDKRLIEFPSILLPPDIHSGSIVDINVARNHDAEAVAEQRFAALQQTIFNTFGNRAPSPPVLRIRNTTQTSVVLEWDPLQLATAELRSLSLYRNGVRVGMIPKEKTCTKISGLALDTEYTFHLVLRTSAGQYSSEKAVVKTHQMTDLHGITVTPGVLPQPLRESLEETIQRIGAKLSETVRIDTTHFVTTEPRGQAWEKAVEMNVPVVVPDWIKGCEREGRIVGVRGYYLDADPKLRQMGPSVAQQQMANRGSVSTARDSPRIEHTPPTPDRPTAQHDGMPQNGVAATNAPTATDTSASTATASRPSNASEVGRTSSSIGGTTVGQEPDPGEEESDEESEHTERDEQVPSAGKGKGKASSEDEDGYEAPGSNRPQAVDDEEKFDEVDL